MLVILYTAMLLIQRRYPIFDPLMPTFFSALLRGLRKPVATTVVSGLVLLPTFPLVQLRTLVRAESVSLSTAVACEGSAVRRAYAGPYLIPLTPPAASGLRGTGTLSFQQSPFGITVTPEGHYLYDLAVQVDGMRNRRAGTPVVWAATPQLDQIQKVGVVGEDGRTHGSVSYNKMLVFVTMEADPDVDRWQGPIVLRGISASGLMHTLAGHGPFEGVVC